MDLIRINQSDWYLMKKHVQSEYPAEACGLLGGKRGKVERVIPIENIARSQQRYRMHPAKQVEAIFQLESEDLDLIAIYHSHPDGGSKPSPIDIAEWQYPRAFSLIWSNDQKKWQCSAYFLIGSEIHPVDLIVLPDRQLEDKG